MFSLVTFKAAVSESLVLPTWEHQECTSQKLQEINPVSNAKWMSNIHNG